jgi:RNA polymerase sigma-70 factor (ECF subfamily)
VAHSVEKHLLEIWPRLYGYAVSLTSDGERARDLVQQCAVQALSAARRPDEAPAIRAWLFRILRNIWIDGRRHDALPPPVAVPAEELRAAWHFDDSLIAGLTVRQGLDRLEPAQREIIELVDIAGFSYAEAGDVLGIPLGTVMSRLSRARLALLAAIDAGTLRASAPQPRRRRTDEVS